MQIRQLAMMSDLLKARMFVHIMLSVFVSSSMPVVAAPSLTISLVSDYVFRGISLTDGPALQASLDYAFDKGVYIGTWTSNYDFDTRSDREVDFYLGYSKEMSSQISWSVNASRYTFIDEHDIDYNEYNAGVAYGAWDAKIWYAVDYGGSDGDAQYYEFGFNHSLTKKISLELRAGHSTFDDNIGISNYTDVSLSAKTQIRRIDLEAKLTDTSEDQFGDREEARIIVLTSTTFSL